MGAFKFLYSCNLSRCPGGFLHFVFAFRQRALVERENDRWLEVGSMSAAATVGTSGSSSSCRQ